MGGVADKEARTVHNKTLFPSGSTSQPAVTVSVSAITSVDVAHAFVFRLTAR
jgi:hypothetical protein